MLQRLLLLHPHQNAGHSRIASIARIGENQLAPGYEAVNSSASTSKMSKRVASSVILPFPSTVFHFSFKSAKIASSSSESLSSV
ncbi:hypothetical protein AVEN_244289-1 [Araneus ventricosus]|uniref:Uncharacterized protein n=1 Tax=Araneus ventricosus TaxID=182803 RepID=A0A4Y2W097_ARAVE|nr:hypothetical protein AVEN_244289-1 [Araneus ventricosus]